MAKIAFIFPGQGSQYVGMGKEFYDNFECAKEMFDKAAETLGFDIKDMIFNGDEETLKITENTQPALLITSMACAKVLEKKGIVPDVVAGLSLGEYTADVVSGAIDFSDAVKLVKKRGKLMQEAVPEGKGAMAAVLGLEREAVENICVKASNIGVVQPANFNCPGQIVISGQKEAVENAIEAVKEAGGKAMLVAMSIPSHCSLMKPAAEKLAKELSNIEILDMKIPVVSNVNAKVVNNKEEINKLLIEQLSSPVLWEDSIRNMMDMGVDTFIEVGPGRVLSGFLKRISKDVKILNVEDMKSLEAAISAIEN